MAKPKTNPLTGILPARDPERTQHNPPGDPLESGRTLPTGVGLKAGTVKALDDLAAGLGVTRNELMKFAIRYFLQEARSGRLDLAAHLETQPVKRTLRNPD